VNKSGVIEQLLPLLKCGGALASFGERLSPDLHTGAGNLSFSIATPKGPFVRPEEGR
jgi:hypothetical protein